MQITYSDGVVSVTMPQSRPYTMGGQPVSRDVELAGGKKKSEMRGFRIAFTASWNWVPQEDIEALLAMIRRKRFLNVTYYDPVLGFTTRSFSLEIEPVNTFRFVDGKPRWMDVIIHHESQELIRNG